MIVLTGRQSHQCLILSLLLLAQTAVFADWPEFRGPQGNGHAAAPAETKPLGLPLHWSESENVKWKIPLPHRGWSTPVVMNGQIWLTTATTDGHEFFAICVDAESGSIRLNKRLFHSDNPEPLGNNMNCYASPSPVVEPKRPSVPPLSRPRFLANHLQGLADPEHGRRGRPICRRAR